MTQSERICPDSDPHCEEVSDEGELMFFSDLPEGEMAESVPREAGITDELVILCAEGDGVAIETLYRQTCKFLEGLLRDEEKNRRRWGSAVMNDLPHDVTSRIIGANCSKLRRYVSFDSPAAGYFKALRTAMRRRLISANRQWTSQARIRGIGEPEGEGKDNEAVFHNPVQSSVMPDPVEQAVAVEFAALVDRVAREVLTAEELTLLRSEMEEVSRDELSASAGVTKGAIASRIFRIRLKLRSALEKELNDTDSTL